MPYAVCMPVASEVLKTCACGCGNFLSPTVSKRVKYIDPTHRNRKHARDFNRRRALERAKERGDWATVDQITAKMKQDQVAVRTIDLSKPGEQRKGPLYEQFVADGWPYRIISGELTRTQVSEETGWSQPNITRWMNAWQAEDAKGRLQRTHEADPEVFSDLVAFTQAFFPKMLVPDFHLEWTEAIDNTVGTGGRLLLLAPQRHGKSEMLIRYCLMRICRDPNVRILWVGKTEDMASQAVGYIRQQLEHNQGLIEAMLGPGGSFRPAKTSGLSWTDSEFTVNNRTEILKSPTMRALGTGGSILGRDADLVILDDPQDRKRCGSPAQRAGDAEWFLTDFLSRKEEETGVAFIMSRQHVEDLPGIVMRDHSQDWDVLMYRAHDPACVKPDEPTEEHQDCVLWPEKRSWRWLLGQKRANVDHFSRNYMNDPKTDATTYVTAENLERITDYTRAVGQRPSDCRLIAGIDPAEAKPVAATLWGFDGIHRHLIDCVEASASVVGLREILAEWPRRYGVREFAFEKNMAGSWLLDTEVKKLIDSQRLVIHQHYTSRVNKQSNAIGPISMFERMRSDPPEITIPGAQGDGLERIDRLKRTWLLFDPDWANSKHADDDLVMASWFPQLIIDGWNRPRSHTMQTQYAAFGGL